MCRYTFHADDGHTMTLVLLSYVPFTLFTLAVIGEACLVTYYHADERTEM